MTTVSTKSGRIIKVVSREEEKSTLTELNNPASVSLLSGDRKPQIHF